MLSFVLFKINEFHKRCQKNVYRKNHHLITTFRQIIQVILSYLFTREWMCSLLALAPDKTSVQILKREILEKNQQFVLKLIAKDIVLAEQSVRSYIEINDNS